MVLDSATKPGPQAAGKSRAVVSSLGGARNVCGTEKDREVGYEGVGQNAHGNWEEALRNAFCANPENIL